MWHILPNLYIFCRFDAVSAIRKPKVITSSPVPKYSLRILFFTPKRNDILHTGKQLTTLRLLYTVEPYEVNSLGTTEILLLNQEL